MSAEGKISATSAARDILRRLHDVMASKAGAQSKLNRVVDIIADGLASEVCSIYLLRDGVLELYATHGLNQSAVHVTRLAVGEGLIGTIAKIREVLNLAEAGAHPDFAYKPETGEERFHSFAGVPIIRRETAIGVVSVQHLEPRDYADVEIEALQTTAMVLAELITASGLVDDLSAERSRDLHPVRITGLKLVEGMGRGQAVFHQPRVIVEHIVAEDTEAERARVYDAFKVMREQIDNMMGQAEFAAPGDHDEILETYKMFAYDEGWSRRINEAIDSGLTAEAAIERVAMKTRSRMRATEDPFFQERLHDLDDLSNRLLRIVAGEMGTSAKRGIKQDMVLLARNLGPAELLEYDKAYLKGVVLEEGSLTAHVTIIARAMGIPLLGRVKDLRTTVIEGDPLLVDGVRGALFVRPSDPVVQQFEEQSALKEKRQAAYAKLRDLDAITTDGVRVSLLMNAGLRSDLDALDVTNADGIGLFRTEFQFLVSATLPRRERQTKLYSAVLDAAGDKPVTFRTVDIGGDKAVPYMIGEEAEENPALGWRAIRLALERGGLMKVQARALIDASANRTLRLMFPMISEPWEFDEARKVVEEQLSRTVANGKPVPKSVKFGAMLEVPALAESLDILLPKIDFLSIGTNDLTQFLFAADRANPKLAERYDWLSISLLRFLKRVVDQAKAAGRPVTICGEMGGRSLEALALLAIGVDRLSITPAAIGPIKAMVRSLALDPLKTEMNTWLGRGTDIRAALTDYAANKGIALG